jgi:hypothetical protein
MGESTMKYVILGQRNNIMRILDEANPRTTEISDELAAKAAEIISSKNQAILFEGDITNPIIENKNGFRFRWNDETKSWSRTQTPKPVPKQISARQIRLWLVAHGISMETVDTAINSITDESIRNSVRVEWEYAPYIERKHAWLVPMATSLGFTEDQIDQAFREAIKL